MVWAPAASARADGLSLNWVRLEGAETCLDAPRLAQLVEARLDRALLQTSIGEGLSIQAQVGPQQGGGYRAVIALHGRNGSMLGQREVKVAAGPCSQLDQPASLIISLLVDPDAALAGRQRVAQSPTDEHLLAQLDLPSAGRDRATAAMSVPEPKTLSLVKQRAGVPAGRMVSVSEDWQQPAAQRRGRFVSSEPASPTPSWPGYALLGLAGASVAAATYTVFRVDALNHDPAFSKYRNSTSVADGVTDVCAAARAGQTFGLDSSVRASVVDTCAEASALVALFWVSAVTTIVGAAAGATWLIWISDDAKEEQSPDASVSLVPYLLGAELSVRM